MEFNQTQALESSLLTKDGELPQGDVEKKVAFIQILPNKHVKTTVYPLYYGDNVIGRENSCKVCIKSQTLSKQHAVIEIKRDDAFLIHDVGSLNKTKKNNSVLKPNVRYNLSNNDKILLADIECRFTTENPEKSSESDSDASSESAFFIKTDSSQSGKKKSKMTDSSEMAERSLNSSATKSYDNSEKLNDSVQLHIPKDTGEQETHVRLSEHQTQQQVVDLDLPPFVSTSNVDDLSEVSIIAGTPAPNRENNGVAKIPSGDLDSLNLEASDSEDESLLNNFPATNTENKIENDFDKDDVEVETQIYSPLTDDKKTDAESASRDNIAEAVSEENSKIDFDEEQPFSTVSDGSEDKINDASETTKNDDADFRQQVLTLLQSPLVSEQEEGKKREYEETKEQEDNDLENVKKFIEMTEPTSRDGKNSEAKLKNDRRSPKSSKSSPDNRRVNPRTRKSNSQKEDVRSPSTRKRKSNDEANDPSGKKLKSPEIILGEDSLLAIDADGEESNKIPGNNENDKIAEDLEKETVKDDEKTNMSDEEGALFTPKSRVNHSRVLESDDEEDAENVKENESLSLPRVDNDTSEKDKLTVDRDDNDIPNDASNDENNELLEEPESIVADTAEKSANSVEIENGEGAQTEETEREDPVQIDAENIPSQNENGENSKTIDETTLMQMCPRRVVIKVEDCLLSSNARFKIPIATGSTSIEEDEEEQKIPKTKSNKSKTLARNKRKISERKSFVSESDKEDSSFETRSPKRRRSTTSPIKSTTPPAKRIAITPKRKVTSPKSSKKKASPVISSKKKTPKRVTPKKKTRVSAIKKTPPIKRDVSESQISKQQASGKVTPKRKTPVRQKNITTPNVTSPTNQRLTRSRALTESTPNPPDVSAKIKSRQISTKKPSLSSKTKSNATKNAISKSSDDDFVSIESPLSTRRSRTGATPVRANRRLKLARDAPETTDDDENSTPISTKKSTRKVEKKVEEKIQVSTPTNENVRPVRSQRRPPKKFIDENWELANDGIGENSASAQSSPNDKANKSLTPRRSSRKPVVDPHIKIMFTGLSNKKAEKIVDSLGGKVVDSIDECTHLITDKVRRTVKLLCMLSKGTPIVNVNWILKSNQAGIFLDSNQFILKDSSAEKQFKFNLPQSLQRAKEGRILEGYRVHVTSGVKPEPNEMKLIIESAGGQFVETLPTRKPANSQTVIVSCPEDLSSCSRAIKQQIPVVDTEFILTGILRQEIDIDNHRLT